MTMIKHTPTNFSLRYRSGVYAEHSDLRTGIPFYRMNWPAFKAAMQYLAEHANDSITLLDTDTLDSLTVTPEGRWY